MPSYPPNPLLITPPAMGHRQFPGLSNWYSSGSRHSMATRAYLSSLFFYFERLSGAGAGTEPGSAYALPFPLMNDWPIIFTLRILKKNKIAQLDPSLLERPLCPLIVVHLPVALTEPSLLGLPDGVCVISTKKNVGFGQTGTREEGQVESSPECCPVTCSRSHCGIIKLIVQGAEAIVTTKEYRREARFDSVLTADYGSSPGDSQWSKWRRWTMLFMDAFQLDQFNFSNGTVADLLPGHRELLGTQYIR